MSGKRKKAVSLGGGGVGGWGGEGWGVEKLCYLRHAGSTGSPRSQNEIVNMQLIFVTYGAKYHKGMSEFSRLI